MRSETESALGGKNQISLILAIVIMVVIGGGAFWGGISYQKTQTAKTRAATASRFGGAAGAGRTGAGANAARGNGAVSGQILSTTDTGITVKSRDGSSKIVVIGNSTVINKSTAGAKTDLTTDENVMVVGTTNSDGSVTATNINIQPAASTPPVGQ